MAHTFRRFKISRVRFFSSRILGLLLQRDDENNSINRVFPFPGLLPAVRCNVKQSYLATRKLNDGKRYSRIKAKVKQTKQRLI